MTIESSKTLGGVGSILLLIGVLPYISQFSFGVLALVGIILILISLNGLANIYKERGIFNNSLYGFIAGIVGAILAAIVALVVVLSNLTSFLQKIYPTWDGKLGDISKLSGMTPTTTGLKFSDVSSLLVGLVAVFVIVWVFLIVWAVFARMSLKSLATKSGVGLFSTAGLLLIIGAALTVVIIGLLLMWVGVLLMAIAFFQIKPQMMQSPTMEMPPTQPTPV